MAQSVGSYAFILGVVIAVIAGLAAAALVDIPGVEYVPLVLVVLGLVIGLLNIADKEINDFLIAAIAVTLMGVTAAGLGEIPLIGVFLVAIVQNIAVLVAPAALVVALKAVYNLAKQPTV